MPLEIDLESFWEGEGCKGALLRWIDAALEEDRATEDCTTRALFGPAVARVRGVVTAGESGVFCGGPAAEEVFRRLDSGLEVHDRAPEGSEARPGETLLEVDGGLGAILAGERTALNILSHLSGIATVTRRWAELAAPVTVLDTRKTLPGLRLFQKYAVRVGGGENHRSSLAASPLVKENHRALFRARHLAPGATAAEEVSELLRRLRAEDAELPVGIEVEDRDSFLACLQQGVDIVLLDNQAPERISEWIHEAEAQGLPVAPGQLEASGGIRGENLAAYASCGVSRVSLGAITHSVRALDLSLDVRWTDRGGAEEGGGGEGR